jgi:hypothetical protein
MFHCLEIPMREYVLLSFLAEWWSNNGQLEWFHCRTKLLERKLGISPATQRRVFRALTRRRLLRCRIAHNGRGKRRFVCLDMPQIMRQITDHASK